MAAGTMMFPPPAWDGYQRHRSAIAGLLDPRCHTIEWLDVRLLNGDAVAFSNDEAAIVVEVRQYPAGATELHGLVACGDLSAILPLIEAAEEWGRSNNITFASIASRNAWSRILRNKSYSLYQSVLRKELCYGPE